MHPSSIVPPPMFFKLAYASDGFYVRLVEAVVSFILDYKQLLIIFICASKFFLVLILTALPPPHCPSSCYFTFGTFPGEQQQTHVLLACFSCCFPATRFVAQPLLYCVYCLSVCLFVSLSACLYVLPLISRTFCWLRCRCRRHHFICCAVYCFCFCCLLAFVAVALAGFRLEVF